MANGSDFRGGGQGSALGGYLVITTALVDMADYMLAARRDLGMYLEMNNICLGKLAA